MWKYINLWKTPLRQWGQMTAFLMSLYGWQCLLDYLVHGTSVTFGHSGGTDNPVFKHGTLFLKCSKKVIAVPWSNFSLLTWNWVVWDWLYSLSPEKAEGSTLLLVSKKCLWQIGFLFIFLFILFIICFYYCSLESKADTSGMYGGEMLRDVGSSVFVSVASKCLNVWV